MTKLVLLRGSAFMAISIYFFKGRHTDTFYSLARELNSLCIHAYPLMYIPSPKGIPPPKW